jgi:hypothetical protein
MTLHFVRSSECVHRIPVSWFQLSRWLRVLVCLLPVSVVPSRHAVSRNLSEPDPVSSGNVWSAGARNSLSLRLNPRPLASLSLILDSEQTMELPERTAEFAVAPQVRIHWALQPHA